MDNIRPPKEHLQSLQTVRKKSFHPLIHHIHKTYRISRDTLFYIKEYGPHSNIPKTIIKESIRILLLASIISSFGGLALENAKGTFVAVTPLIILLPALNNMIGSYGTVISSKFSTLLHEGLVKDFWKSPPLKKLFLQTIFLSIIIGLLTAFLAILVSDFQTFITDPQVAVKIFLITILDIVLLIGILFSLAVFAGLYVYKKGEDPSNFLIPITTSVADFGNMILMAVLISIFF